MSITAVPSLKLPDGVTQLDLVTFPDRNAIAFLTHDWDHHCLHLDRSAAIGGLLLTAFNGTGRSKWSRHLNRLKRKLAGVERTFHRNLVREAALAASRRKDAHSTSGCYLIYVANALDLMEPPKLDAARRFGKVGFGIDTIHGAPYRSIHEPAVHATASALAAILAKTTGSSETHHVGDVLFMEGKDELVIYCKFFSAGSPTILVTRSPESLELEDVSDYVNAILSDDVLRAATSLLVQSQLKENRNIESFAAAWAALELFTKSLSMKISPQWAALLADNSFSIPVETNRDLKGVSFREYTLRDRFLAIACVLNLAEAPTSYKEFSEIYSDRNDFYHAGGVKAEQLPTSQTQSLFHKYLRLAMEAGTYNAQVVESKRRSS